MRVLCVVYCDVLLEVFLDLLVVLAQRQLVLAARQHDALAVLRAEQLRRREPLICNPRIVAVLRRLFLLYNMRVMSLIWISHALVVGVREVLCVRVHRLQTLLCGVAHQVATRQLRCDWHRRWLLFGV